MLPLRRRGPGWGGYLSARRLVQRRAPILRNRTRECQSSLRVGVRDAECVGVCAEPVTSKSGMPRSHTRAEIVSLLEEIASPDGQAYELVREFEGGDGPGAYELRS